LKLYKTNRLWYWSLYTMQMAQISASIQGYQNRSSALKNFYLVTGTRLADGGLGTGDIVWAIVQRGNDDGSSLQSVQGEASVLAPADQGVSVPGAF
jgi:hypothetical protein